VTVSANNLLFASFIFKTVARIV